MFYGNLKKDVEYLDVVLCDVHGWFLKVTIENKEKTKKRNELNFFQAMNFVK